jgi:FAD/FMN-containing dehydrogenase
MAFGLMEGLQTMDPGTFEKVKSALISALGEGKVLWRGTDLASYSTGGFIHAVKVGDREWYSPDFAVLPENTAEVQKVVMIAAEHKIPILPKGGGSNLTGMLAPIVGGIVIDTIKMNKVLEVNLHDLYATVQPGITLKEVDVELAKHGLALNQLQGSYKVATVGGSISTSGYPRKHNKYGTIADRIMSLEVVLADGRVLRTGQKVLYTSTGYRLAQLFIGAEGTLGVITEATLRVEPLPEAQQAVMAYYDDFRAAVKTVVRIKTSGVTYVGGEAFEVPQDWAYEVPNGKNALVVVDFEGTKGEVAAEVEYASRILKETGGVLASPEDAQGYVKGYDMIWCGLRAEGDVWGDSVLPYIPIDRLMEFYDKMWNEIMPKYGLVHGPAGERCGLDCGRYEMGYATFLVPTGPDGFNRHEDARRELAALSTSLGGSFIACMGIGLKYIDCMDMEFSEVALDTMRKIKATLDPDGIMNPGKKLPPPKG